ncbi:MAG: hypothetical protein ACM3ZS_09525 [Nitrososphaerota archaeon]|jgi:hypothetical protein
MTGENNAHDSNTILEDQIVTLEKKVDSLLEQHKATQRAIAHLKADNPAIIKSALNKRTVQGYSRIATG